MTILLWYASAQGAWQRFWGMGNYSLLIITFPFLRWDTNNKNVVGANCGALVKIGAKSLNRIIVWCDALWCNYVMWYASAQGCGYGLGHRQIIIVSLGEKNVNKKLCGLGLYSKTAGGCVYSVSEVEGLLLAMVNFGTLCPKTLRQIFHNFRTVSQNGLSTIPS